MKRLQCLTIILFVLSSFPLWAQNKDIRFVPESYSVGVIEQGDVRHIVLKGVNTTSKTIVLESVMSQNTGSSNFKHPSVIKPNETITIEFDLNTSYMEVLLIIASFLWIQQGLSIQRQLKVTFSLQYFLVKKCLRLRGITKPEKNASGLYVWSTGIKKLAQI